VRRGAGAKFWRLVSSGATNLGSSDFPFSNSPVSDLFSWFIGAAREPVPFQPGGPISIMPDKMKEKNK
jgi:hypothetical protein